MPELPEVETTKNGVRPHVLNKVVSKVVVRQPSLRWPVPSDLAQLINNATLKNVERRAKYLLCHFEGVHEGTVMIHLGMSGNLRIVASDAPVQKHDHVDIVFQDGTTLRYCDPRRFGCVLWLGEKPYEHSLLSGLGPEPLTDEFNADYLWQLSRNKKTAVKQFVMDQKVVTGIGNIYATEALFTAGIRPNKEAGKVSKASYDKFVQASKTILERAIAQGGTTLKDFVGGDGKPGYFAQQLLVYGKKGEECPKCASVLKEIKLSNRSSVYCPKCQG